MRTRGKTANSPPPPPGGEVQSEPLVVGLYLRVSTDFQVKEGDSLEEQERELRKYCEFRNFPIHKLYIEKGKSGGTTNRPEYQAMIRDIQAKKIDAVIVKKLDRLSRSLLDFEQLMVLFQSHNVDFISLREQFDTTNAMGKAMLRMALVFAQLEREQTSERITDVMDYRASLGQYNGGPVPYGYHVLNKELIPNQKEKAVVELIFSKFLETRSVTAVARFLNDTRIRTRKDQSWVDTQLQIILENPVYVGQIRWKNQIYNGLHLPLISKSSFEEVQAIFANSQTAPKRFRSAALFQKLLYCGECQNVMTTSFAMNRTKTKYHYYRCVSTTKAEVATSSCTLKYIPQTDLESQFFRSLHNLCHPGHFKPIQGRIDTHNRELDDRIAHLKTEATAIESQLSTLKTQTSRYLDALISNEFLSEERNLIRTQINTLETEQRKLQSQVSHLNLEISQHSENRIHFDRFKLQIIQLLELYQSNDASQLQRQIPLILNQIIRYHTHWSVQFTSIAWTIDIPLFSDP